MKRTTLFPILLISLVACKPPSTDGSEDRWRSEYLARDTKPEVRPLTPEIRKALNVPDAAFVTAFGNSGKAFVYESEGTQTATYPVSTNAIKAIYAEVLTAFWGSHCVDRVDSTGTTRRTCYSAGNPCHAAHTC